MSNAKKEETHWVISKLNKAGEEIMDPKPLFEKIGFKKPPSLEQKLQMMLAQERQMMRDQMEIDPEEELNFDIDEDPDLLSPYEAEVLYMEEEQLDIESALADKDEVGNVDLNPDDSSPNAKVEGEGSELST